MNGGYANTECPLAINGALDGAVAYNQIYE